MFRNWNYPRRRELSFEAFNDYWSRDQRNNINVVDFHSLFMVLYAVQANAGQQFELD